MKCQDCKGSGVYWGLEKQETCARCKGSRVEPAAISDNDERWDLIELPNGGAVRRGRTRVLPADTPAVICMLMVLEQDQLAEAIRGLKEPLPQIVFEVADEVDWRRVPNRRWWWLYPPRSEWLTGSYWVLLGTCATPGPEPRPGAPVLQIETVEALEALLERYKDA